MEKNHKGKPIGTKPVDHVKNVRREDQLKDHAFMQQTEACILQISQIGVKISSMKILLENESSRRQFINFLRSCGGAYLNYLQFWIASSCLKSFTIVELLFDKAMELYSIYVDPKAANHIILSPAFKEKMNIALNIHPRADVVYSPNKTDIISIFQLIRHEILKAFAETTYNKFLHSKQYVVWYVTRIIMCIFVDVI